MRNESASSTQPMESGAFWERQRSLAARGSAAFMQDISSPKCQMFEYDLLQAVRIQQALLPPPNPIFPGYQIGYHYAPAGLVGGDCCDLIECNGGLLFLFGDVCGKGVSASLLMSHLHGTFQGLAAMNSPLDGMVEVANRVFSQRTSLGHFATLVVGRAGRDGSVELISAGHPPSLHLGKACIRYKTATTQPFGMFVGARFPIHRFSLDPGDALLFYTDGVTEHLNPAGQEYGLRRLENAAVKHHPTAPSELIAGCLADLNAFAMGIEQTDDMSLLVIRRAE